jgi:hypothetical protein
MSLPNYLYGVSHEILHVFIIILYEYVFQNPELFRTQVSLSHKQSTLVYCTFLLKPARLGGAKWR